MRTIIRALIPLTLLAVLTATAGAASPAAAVGSDGGNAVTAVAAAPDPPVYLIKVSSGTTEKCLDADLTGTGRVGNKVQVWTCTGAPNQLWTFAGANSDRIHNVWAAGKYELGGFLTATGNYNGAPVQLSDYPGGPIPNQIWTRAPGSNLIRNPLGSGRCLSVDLSGGFVNGAVVNIAPCTSGYNQIWRVETGQA